MKELSLAVRFASELAALAAVGWWGWTVNPIVGVLLPVVVAGVWGAVVGPKAQRRLPDPGRLALELVIFAGATASFLALGQTAVAIVFAVAAAGTALLVRRWPEPGRTSDSSQTRV